MQVVPRERGEQFASQYNMFFLETSAKTGFNIDKLFETLAQSILEKVGLLLLRLVQWNLFTLTSLSRALSIILHSLLLYVSGEGFHCTIKI